MSWNPCKDEERQREDAAWDARRTERARLKEEHEQKFGALLDKLEELGIDPDLLAECLATLPR